MSSSEFTKPELPALGIMSNLDDADRGLLSGYGEFLPVQDGDTLIKEGAEQNSLYFVISGVLHVHSESDGKRTLIGRVDKGETFGEIAVFDPGPASANVTAQGFCQVWKASREDLGAFRKAYPEPAGDLLVGLMQEMSVRFRRMIEKLEIAQVEASIQNFFH